MTGKNMLATPDPDALLKDSQALLSFVQQTLEKHPVRARSFSEELDRRAKEIRTKNTLLVYGKPQPGTTATDEEKRRSSDASLQLVEEAYRTVHDYTLTRPDGVAFEYLAYTLKAAEDIFASRAKNAKGYGFAVERAAFVSRAAQPIEIKGALQKAPSRPRNAGHHESPGGQVLAFAPRPGSHH